MAPAMLMVSPKRDTRAAPPRLVAATETGPPWMPTRTCAARRSLAPKPSSVAALGESEGKARRS